jgi:hypothetical protein
MVVETVVADLPPDLPQGGTSGELSLDEIKWCKDQLKAHHVVLGKSWGTLPEDYKDYWTA